MSKPVQDADIQLQIYNGKLPGNNTWYIVQRHYQ